MPAASLRIWDARSCYTEFSISAVLAPPFFCPPVFHFFRRLQSLNSLIELKSASQITARAGDRPMAPRLPNGGGGCTQTFFRCHFFLWCRRTTAHSCICVFVEWKSSRIRCAVRRRLMRVYSHCSTNAAANLIITRIFHVGGTHSFGAVRISVGVQERSNSNRRWSGERPSASQLSASTAAGKKNKKTLNCVFLCFW